MAAAHVVPLILAAGKGVRMKSALAKVCHPVCGKPLVRRVVEAAQAVTPEQPRVVVGAGADDVREALEGLSVHWVYQKEQLGTGHAVMQARDDLAELDQPVMILSGDTPLLRPETLRAILEHHAASGAVATVTTTEVADPSGYGRVLRSQHGGAFLGIVEDRDARDAERRIREINAGLYVVDARPLYGALERVGRQNDQGEYYLTDAFALLAEDEHKVEAFKLQPADELLGINDRAQLGAAEAVLRRRNCVRLQLAGVTVEDPASTWIDDDVVVGRDTVLEPGVHLRAGTAVGEGCRIGVGSVLRGCRLGDRVEVHPYTVGDDAELRDEAQAGPFARLRAGALLMPGARMGNFVEMKKATLGAGSKALHLAYLGDATVGEGCNIGAGTITCNYDGVKKHPTVIEDSVFIGSNSTLVAPVTVRKRAYVAAASCVNREVPSGALAIARARQENKEGYRERLERRMRGGKE